MEVGMVETLSRRERKKVETRQKLLEAARALFHSKGYDATTVEEITERADVAKGTFFNYFPSKEALLGELRVWHIGQLRDALDVTQGAPPSPVARIKLLMQLVQEQSNHHARLARQTLARRLCQPPPPPRRTGEGLFGLFTELVKEAQSCGEIRADVDAELVSGLLRIFYFHHMVAHPCDDGGSPPRDQLDAVIDLWMEGLAGPDWRPR
jgi:AcrR family transcriptional regulator